MPQTDRLALALKTRALPLPEEGAIIVLRAEPSEFLDLVPQEHLHCEQTFRPTHDCLRDRNTNVAPHLEGIEAACVVINLTRSKVEALGNIARGLEFLRPGGLLVVNGNKTEGIDSLMRQVGKLIPITDSYVKAHGRVLWLTRPETLPAEVALWRQAIEPGPNADGFVTRPGIFSADGIDPGSALLASSLPAGLKGRVADLGAGWGWLSASSLAAHPDISTIDLYEAEHLALEAARQNVMDSRAAFHWADVTTLGRDVPPYDVVLSNPPFHQGRAAEPQIGAEFIAAAARILKPSGRFLMVANRQLPYEAQLDARFNHWERLTEDRHYKVFAATRPRRA